MKKKYYNFGTLTRVHIERVSSITSNSTVPEQEQITDDEKKTCTHKQTTISSAAQQGRTETNPTISDRINHYVYSLPSHDYDRSTSDYYGQRNQGDGNPGDVVTRD